MKLLLTSAGNTNASIEKALLELLDKPFSESTATFIPTASNIGRGDKRWFVDQMNSFRKLNFKQFDVVDISALPSSEWLPRVQNVDMLIFSGGNVSHLLFWMKKSGLADILPHLLQHVVYVGISAGSMATATSLALSNPKKKEIAKSLGEYMGEEGMGFIHFHIRPHYNAPDLAHAQTENIKKIAKELHEDIYAIDDDTAIQVIDDDIKVISEGVWDKFS